MTMPKFVVEGEIPGIGTWSAGRPRKIAEKSRAVLREMWPDNIAPGPELTREHAAWRGFPCNRVSKVGAVIDPTAVEARP
jgi:hypothetical protein